MCACGCVAVVGVVSGSIWVSWKLCGVRKTTSHKSGGSPMFYKDRTLLRMSLRKTLGLGPYVGWKTSLSLSLFPLFLSLSRLIFHLVRDTKEEDKIDSEECGRQRLRRGRKPGLIAIPSVCIEQRVSGDRLCGRGGVRRSRGGIWCTLALALSGNNHSKGEGDESREGGRKGMSGWRVEEVKVLPKRRARNSVCCSHNASEWTWSEAGGNTRQV